MVDVDEKSLVLENDNVARSALNSLWPEIPLVMILILYVDDD